jgi:uncharacterized protein YbjT (DUF2867 family)
LRLIFGASGYIGSNLVPALVAAGQRVRASARNVEVLEARGWRGVDLVAADALDPASLRAALEDVEVAYYLVHSMAAGRDFAALDRRAAENFARAAAEAGVRRIVYLGGLIPPDPRSEHLRSRAETGEVLRRFPVPVTEIRAGMIIGPGSAAYEVIRDLVNHLPVMVTPSWVRSRSTPIALPDLLAYLVAVADIEGAAGRVLDAGGPDAVTYEEIMRCYGRLVGRHPRILAVPVLTPRLSSYWLRFVTSVPTSVARALVEGLEHDFVADDAALRALVPRRLMGLEESVRAAIDADRRHEVVARWVEGAIACRNFHPEYGYYAMRAGAEAEGTATPEAVFRTVCTIGGSRGYFFADTLWNIRRAIDWLAGGPSFRRRRRHPTELRVGDVVDSWRVIALEPGRRLTLLMEMKAPGAGVLEFVVRPGAGGTGSRVSATAYWHPAGVFGLVYWYSLVPAHLFLFKGLTRAIQRLSASHR